MPMKEMDCEGDKKRRKKEFKERFLFRFNIYKISYLLWKNGNEKITNTVETYLYLGVVVAGGQDEMREFSLGPNSYSFFLS